MALKKEWDDYNYPVAVGVLFNYHVSTRDQNPITKYSPKAVEEMLIDMAASDR